MNFGRRDGDRISHWRTRRYWTATGVTPRWQLLLVYALIVAASLGGMASLQASVNENCERIHRLAQAGEDVLIQSGANPDLVRRWRAGDCPPVEEP